MTNESSDAPHDHLFKEAQVIFSLAQLLWKVAYYQKKKKDKNQVEYLLRQGRKNNVSKRTGSSTAEKKMEIPDQGATFFGKRAVLFYF